MRGLKLQGTAWLKVPSSTTTERVVIESPFETAQVVFALDQESTKSGSTIPRVNVQSVSFALTDAIRVNLFGELPLYQTHKYEDAIKLWLKGTLLHRERDFALKFQHTEQQVLKLFDYTSRLLQGDDLDET